MTPVEDDEDWTPLQELLALHTAGSPDELRRRLVVFPPASVNAANDFEPWCLLSSMHKGNPEGGASTALLLLTDRRWINAAGRFVRRIEESDLLSQDDLDLLARTFLAAGEQVYWEAPGHWFGGPIVQIELGVRTGNEPLEEQVDAEDDPPVVVAREVRPPLRRWAAGRLVRREPASWSALVHRAGEVDARAGAAIMLGLLDGIEALAPAARELIIGMTAAWPQSDVRKTATEVAPVRSQRLPRPGPGPRRGRRRLCSDFAVPDDGRHITGAGGSCPVSRPAAGHRDSPGGAPLGH